MFIRLAAVALVLALQAGIQSHGSQDRQISDAEYEVFSTYLYSSSGADATHRGVEVVVEELEVMSADVADSGANIHEGCEAAPNDLFHAFDTASKTTGRIDSKQIKVVDAILISSEKIQRIFAPGVDEGWEVFHTEYPKQAGFTQLSHVGFDQSGTWALFYAGISCGGLCGQGNLIVMHKTNDKWQQVCEQMLWIS